MNLALREYRYMVSPQMSVVMAQVLESDGIYPGIDGARIAHFGLIPGTVSLSFQAHRWYGDEHFVFPEQTGLETYNTISALQQAA